MITGRVTTTPEAVVELLVRGPLGHESRIQAVLDTGFTDYLTLPLATVAELRLVPMDMLECQLADRHIVAMESFQVVVMWDGSPREILALAAEGEPLLGMSLLYGSRVILNVLAGRDVTIEAL